MNRPGIPIQQQPEAHIDVADRTWKLMSVFIFSLISLMITGPGLSQNQPVRSEKTAPQSVAKITFKLEGMRDGFTTNDTPFYCTVFSASDGTEIYRYFIRFRNASDAQSELRKMEHLAVKILTQGKETDKAGRVIGRRLIMRIPPTKSQQSMVWLIWNDGRTVHETAAHSLEDLLAFEHLPADTGSAAKLPN